jgi:hypothetical protein
MCNIIRVEGLNVYNPTDDEVLAMAKADIVKWIGRGDGRFYHKVGVQGPIKQGSDVLYMIRLGPETSLPKSGLSVKGIKC